MHIRVFQTNLIVFKELEKEGGDSCSDADEEVDDDEEHIRCRGHLKPEGRWVHDGRDGPPERLHSSQCLFSFIVQPRGGCVSPCVN